MLFRYTFLPLLRRMPVGPLSGGFCLSPAIVLSVYSALTPSSSSGEIALASHKSALKAHRQSLKRRARNRIVKGHVRGAIKRTRAAIAAGDLAAAQEYLREAVSNLDRAAKKGVIHPNNAARRKSRLMKLFNRTAAGQ